MIRADKLFAFRNVLCLIAVPFAFVMQAHGWNAVTQQRGDNHGRKPAAGKIIEIQNVQARIPDVEVFDHRGKRLHLYSDLIKDKVVLLSFFYTTCTYVCAMQGASLAKVQKQLEPLGKNVFLISISMDPRRDTPDKLKQWGRTFHAGSRWSIVSSDTPEMSQMIKEFTGENIGPKDLHSSTVFLGNDRTGEWLATDGLFGPKALVSFLKKLSDVGADKQRD